MATFRFEGSVFRTLSRVGYATKGAVYCLMGLLALLAAAGQRGGQIGDKQRSVHTLQALPGGRVLLGIIAVGLTGYALLRIGQGVFDSEHKGHGAGGLVRRFGYVVNGLIYGGLIYYAGFSAWIGHVASDSRTQERTLTARVLNWPGGPWLITLIGGVIVGAGVYTGYQAYTSKFLSAIELHHVSNGSRTFVRRAGQAGYAARGAVMLIMGSFFIHAGKSARASYIGNAADALDLIAKMGPVVLGVVSLGLVAYGLYALLQAVYPVRH